MGLKDKMESYDWRDLYEENYGDPHKEEQSSSIYKYEVKGLKFMTLRQAAEEFNVSESHLSAMLNGYTDNHMGVRIL